MATLSERLRAAGLENAIPAQDDLTDPDLALTMGALNVVFEDPASWGIEVKSLEPLQLQLVGQDPCSAALLSGREMGTPRDRARTAVARAFAAVVSGMTERSLKLGFRLDLSRLDDADYRDSLLSSHMRRIRMRLARLIEEGGYLMLMSLGSGGLPETGKS